MVAREITREAGHLSAYELRPQHLGKLIDSWRLRWGIATVCTRRKYLVLLVKWLVAQGANPGLRETIPLTKTPSARTVIAKDGELESAIKLASPFLRCWIEITAGHGLRFAEALRLCPRDVDTADQTMTYRTKGDRTNTLPIGDDLFKIFASVETPGNTSTPYLEIIAGKKIGPFAVRNAWRRLKKKAGVNPEVRPHDLRRTLAVRAYESTKDLRAVQQMLGHKNLTTTCLYLENRDHVKLRSLMNTLRAEQKAAAAAAAGRLTN
jgi:integrase